MCPPVLHPHSLLQDSGKLLLTEGGGGSGRKAICLALAGVCQAWRRWSRALLAWQQETDVSGSLPALVVALSDRVRRYEVSWCFCGHPMSLFAFVPDLWQTAGNLYAVAVQGRGLLASSAMCPPAPGARASGGATSWSYYELSRLQKYNPCVFGFGEVTDASGCHQLLVTTVRLGLGASERPPWASSRMCKGDIQEGRGAAGGSRVVRGSRPPLDTAPPASHLTHARGPEHIPHGWWEENRIHPSRQQSLAWHSCPSHSRAAEAIVSQIPAPPAEPQLLRLHKRARFVSAERSDLAPHSRSASRAAGGVGQGPGRPPGACCRGGRRCRHWGHHPLRSLCRGLL